jgi:hypothetical protein
MNQPSCEDLRLGKTIEGFLLHSPLGQGPFFRIYGANKGTEEWKVFAWDKIPPPPKDALDRFEKQSKTLASLQQTSIIPVVGPLLIPEDSVGWAVFEPSAKNGGNVISDGAKASTAAPGFAAIAKALSAASQVGVFHPGLSAESLWFSKVAPFGLVGGFFSWRRIYPEISRYLPPEEENPHSAPEGTNQGTEAALVYSLSSVSQEFGLTPPPEALSENPQKRPSLLTLADSFSSQRPGFFGRLFGK